MNSHITQGFRKLLAALPDDVRRQAGSAYRQFMENPRHPGLRFKQIHGSARFGPHQPQLPCGGCPEIAG